MSRSPLPGRAVATAIVATLAATGCSLGQGDGKVYCKELVAHDCWEVGDTPDKTDAAEYDMLPDFFAAIPYRDTLQIRVQRGTDLQEVSDGLSVLIDDVPEIRKHRLGKPLRVALPLGVAPPGTTPEPLPDLADPPLVHMSLYLQRSCHNQNIVLYAVDGEITFDELFSGDPNEAAAKDKLTKATFKVTMGDPHDAPAGHYPSEIPEKERSIVSGWFTFYFERGQPGQPFP